MLAPSLSTLGAWREMYGRHASGRLGTVLDELIAELHKIDERRKRKATHQPAI